jgi:hypothetical protein
MAASGSISIPVELTLAPDGISERILDSLHSLHRKVDRMSDALAGIQTDEQELASLVPEILTTLTAVQAQLAAATADGTPVDPTELASIQSGLDGVVTQLQGAVPAPTPAPAPTPESTPEPTPAPAQATPAPVDSTPAPEGDTPTV